MGWNATVAKPAKEWILDRLLSPVTFGTGPVERVLRFFAHDVWRAETADLGLGRRALYRCCRVLYLTWRGFAGDKVISRASALTYITALSLVPLLAFAFSVLKGFGFYQRLLDETINPFLDKLLQPLAAGGGSGVDQAAGGEVGLREALDEVLALVTTTDVKGLGFVGLLIVLWAVMRLLGSVEGAFNDIWGLRQSRSFLRKLSDYLTIVIVVPILLVVGIGFRTMLETTFDTSATMQAVIEFGLRGALPLGAWAAFTCVYLVLPNTRARFMSVLLGGGVAALLWLAALALYVGFQVGVARYNAIYAGFAVLPVFLVWVQLSWVIVLLGAELAFAHEHEPEYRGLASYQSLGHGSLERLALGSMTRITMDFLAGEAPRRSSAIAAELGLSPQPVEELLASLAGAGLLLAVADDGDESSGGGGYVLARDPSSITVKGVLDALKHAEGDLDVRAGAAADVEVRRLLSKLDGELEGSAFNLDLRELARRAERAEVPEGQTGVQPAGVQPS